jgi:hypothetical protein
MNTLTLLVREAANTSAPGEWGRNYGPATDHAAKNSAHLIAQPWTPAIRDSRSTTVEARSGVKVASSNRTPAVLDGADFSDDTFWCDVSVRWH